VCGGGVGRECVEGVWGKFRKSLVPSCFWFLRVSFDSSVLQYTNLLLE
jgi:hypothetical protein